MTADLQFTKRFHIDVTSSAESVTTSDATTQTNTDHTVPTLRGNSALPQDIWELLWHSTEDHRAKSSMPTKERREAILTICSGNFISKEELGQLFGMESRGLRNRFLSPMQSEGLLEHRFPNQPNHQDQAYRSTGETNLHS